ncbi:MAG: hypothetical protein Q8P18_10765 [Pseudomonadota bacterium]|nr:hypothetical protein [Pseudomonadota bacterium]
MIVLLASLAALTSSAWAFDPVIQELSEGRIDWTALRLLASAEGVPSGGVLVNLETLEGDARQRLGPRMLAMARKVRISADLTAADLLDAKDAVADRIDDNLMLWEVYEVRYYMSGGVEMEGALPLQAWLRPALVSLAKGKDRTTPATAPTSGLVIDARGLDLSPALSPRLQGPGGETLYSVAAMTVLAASQRTPVVYVTDPADVAAGRRAGGQPLFVRAQSVTAKTDLVLDAADAARVAQAAVDAPFLLQGNVVVVVDK